MTSYDFSQKLISLAYSLTGNLSIYVDLEEMKQFIVSKGGLAVIQEELLNDKPGTGWNDFHAMPGDYKDLVDVWACLDVDLSDVPESPRKRIRMETKF